MKPDSLFTTRYGTPIESRNFQRSWPARCEKTNVKPITVHDARRTCATLLADLDVHPRVAMQVLTHARFSVTMEIYTQVSNKATRDALAIHSVTDAVAVPSCCTTAERPPPRTGKWPLTCVGDAGIEPATSSV
jgi:integrase